MAAFNPTYGIVNNEECDLHYWSQGSGAQLIIFVPGGNGQGAQFNNMITALSSLPSNKYTCATFDRRQMSASQVKTGNKMFKPPQQARDVLAVVKALGFSKAIVFGSSSGGIIALQFAHDFPEAVGHVIAHEAPTTLLLPDASAKFEWLVSCYEAFKTGGVQAAFGIFMTEFAGYDDPGLPPTQGMEPSNAANFWGYEFIIASFYIPNLRKLVEDKVSVGVMTGKRSGKAFYARTPFEQAKILGCPLAEVPGHHQGFEAETAEFAPAMLDLLAVLEKKKAERA